MIKEKYAAEPLHIDFKINYVTDDARVYLNGQEISPEYSQKLRNHSPDGFSWGYAGSGPAQSALALCAEIFEHEYEALALYQQFKFKFIAPLVFDRPNKLTIQPKELSAFYDVHKEQVKRFKEYDKINKEFENL